MDKVEIPHNGPSAIIVAVSIVAKMLYKVFKLKYVLAKFKYIWEQIFPYFGDLKPHFRSLQLMKIFHIMLAKI